MVLSMKRWKNTVAIVTGASSGIGAAVVEQLVEEGVNVVGIARRLDRLEELSQKLSSKSGKFYYVKADMTKEDEIIEAFEWTNENIGPVHILINNAGLTLPTTLIDGNTEMWKTVFDTNVIGLSIATREALKIMQEHNIDGHIVHINSIAGHIVPDFPGLNVYPASKHAVSALTETLRQELNHMGSKIKITSVSPGCVFTEFFNNAIESKEASGDSLDKFLQMTPLLHAEDIADAIMYVISTPPNVQVHELIIKPIGEKL